MEFLSIILIYNVFIFLFLLFLTEKAWILNQIHIGRSWTWHDIRLCQVKGKSSHKDALYDLDAGDSQDDDARWEWHCNSGGGFHGNVLSVQFKRFHKFMKLLYWIDRTVSRLWRDVSLLFKIIIHIHTYCGC